MRIRRSAPERDFLQVPNATVRDDRLSHMARGILAELLSRPDGWETTADDMWRASVARHGKDSPGRRQFRAAFAELKEHGYLTAAREPLPGGRHATILTLSDVPQGGTPEPPAETHVPTGQTDVPDAGTPDEATDVPHGGTSAPPAQTDVSAGRTDVPLSDVPPCGTSNKKTEEEHGRRTRKAAAARGCSSLDGELLFDGTGTEITPGSQPPERPDPFAELKTAIAAAGLGAVSWEIRRFTDWQRIKNQLDRLGIDIMVRSAVNGAHLRGEPDNVTAWIGRWESLADPVPTDAPAANQPPAVNNVIALPIGQQLTGTDARVAGWLALPTGE